MSVWLRCFVQALANEPAGTFICRFSMSQPGCLVLSCKTAPGHPKADADNLIHAIIRVSDPMVVLGHGFGMISCTSQVMQSQHECKCAHVFI